MSAHLAQELATSVGEESQKASFEGDKADGPLPKRQRHEEPPQGDVVVEAPQDDSADASPHYCVFDTILEADSTGAKSPWGRFKATTFELVDAF